MHDGLGEGQRGREWVLSEDGTWVEMVLWLCFSGTARGLIYRRKQKMGPRTA